MPISYSPDDGQHYHQLKVYKSPSSPNRLALYRLAVLYTLFYSAHQRCLEQVAGGRFTHVTTVPSTRSRIETHPLHHILGAAHPDLPAITGRANDAHGNAREFHRDRFSVPSLESGARHRILLLEDLWVTGARAQSMAHALKKAGATTVVIVALGRHLNTRYESVRPILATAKSRNFDLSQCALDPLASG